MSNGRINAKDLLAGRIDGKIIREIAMKDSDGDVARWRPDVVDYDGTVYPKFRATFDDRANGNLADGVDFIHHPINSVYNRVLDGEVVGPTSAYAMDVINHRLSSFSVYIKAKFKSPLNTPANARLQARGGNKPVTSGASYQWLTPRIWFASGDVAMSLEFFRNGWGSIPGQFSIGLTVADEYRAGDEIMVLLQGRTVFYVYNGRFLGAHDMSDVEWMPGYFMSIMLDPDHSIDELEIGHYNYDFWYLRGDNFKSPDLSVLWNSSGTPTQVLDGAVQIDPTTITSNGTYRGYNYSKYPIDDVDQFVRASVKDPFGVTRSNSATVVLIARCGVNGATETETQIAFVVSMTSGAQIATMSNGALTTRKSASASEVGTITLPADLELQCIGNRYMGIVNGNCVLDWTDETNLVVVSKERSYYAHGVSVVRSSSSSYSYSLAFDNVQGLTFGDSHFELPTPAIQRVYPSVLPLVGGEFTILGTGLAGTSGALDLGTTRLSRSEQIISDNSGSFSAPARAAGFYDLLWSSTRGNVSLPNAIQYVAPVPRGKYDAISTTLTPTNQWVKVPLNPETPFVSDTQNGIIVGLPKGFYRFQQKYTLAYFRSYIQSRLNLPAGLTTPVSAGAASSGAVDMPILFSVGANGSMELDYLSSNGTRVIEPTFDFELELLSTTLLPAWVRKTANQLLAATTNTYFKVESLAAVEEYAGTTALSNNEITVPETGQYTVQWQVTFTTNISSNVARVTNQAGTVIASKTTTQTMGSSVVNLTKGDILKLEVMITSASDTGRRTITTATMFRIVPVV